MEGIFGEFENENALRAYPFAAGCVRDGSERPIPPGLFVDAALYPVNPSGPLYLSEVSADGTFSVSDDTGVVMSGKASGDVVEFHDRSALGRKCGILAASSSDALADFAWEGSLREYSREEATFASSCTFPVVVDGVSSLSVGGLGPVAGDVSFANGSADDVRVSSGTAADGRRTLRFDVLPRPGALYGESIRRIICVVDGETPFRIAKLYDKSHPEAYGYNTVILTLDGIGRDAICSAAHRENAYEMADTCGCERKVPREESLPEAYQLEEVFIPPDEDGTEGGVSEGSENAFFLVVPDIPGYENPLSVTLVEGTIAPDTDGPEFEVDGMTANLKEGELNDDVVSKGVVIQVPGLSGGAA